VTCIDNGHDDKDDEEITLQNTMKNLRGKNQTDSYHATKFKLKSWTNEFFYDEEQDDIP